MALQFMSTCIDLCGPRLHSFFRVETYNQVYDTNTSLPEYLASVELLEEDGFYDVRHEDLDNELQFGFPVLVDQGLI